MSSSVKKKMRNVSCQFNIKYFLRQQIILFLPRTNFFKFLSFYAIINYVHEGTLRHPIKSNKSLAALIVNSHSQSINRKE